MGKNKDREKEYSLAFHLGHILLSITHTNLSEVSETKHWNTEGHRSDLIFRDAAEQQLPLKFTLVHRACITPMHYLNLSIT